MDSLETFVPGLATQGLMKAEHESVQFQAHNGNAPLSKPGLGNRAEDMPHRQAEELVLQVKALKAANKEAINRAGMLEDMDTQLRNQLEKMIHQRNQCSAEKAQRDLEIQHLQAQVYLLEADVSNRQHGTDSPRTPSRDPEEAAELLHQQIEHLHNENVRLHAEAEAATSRVYELERDLEKQQSQTPAQQPETSPQRDNQLKLQQSGRSVAAAAQQHKDTPLSKVHSSPAPPTAATLHLQEELSQQQQLTRELKQTVAKLTSQLAESSPGTPSHGTPQRDAATTPVTYPTESAAASHSPSSPDAASSDVEDASTAAEPMQLFSKFQQADKAADASQMQLPTGKEQAGIMPTIAATPHKHSDALSNGDQAASSHAEAPANGMPASQESSPMQLSLPTTAASSPNMAETPGPNMQMQGSGFKSVTHVNDSFDASDEEVGSDSASPSRETLLPSGRLSRQQKVEAEPSRSKIELLQTQAEQQQQLLRSLLQRAEGAEDALKEVQTALAQAEDIAAALQRRNNTIEVAHVMTSCVAAFLAASAGTLYLLH